MFTDYPEAPGVYAGYCTDDPPANSPSHTVSANNLNKSGMTGAMKFFIVLLVFSTIAAVAYGCRKYDEDPNYL